MLIKETSTNTLILDRAWLAYARATDKRTALASLEGVIIGSVFPVDPQRLKPHQNDWALLSALLKYYVPLNQRDLTLKESLMAYCQRGNGSPTEWMLMEKLILGLPETSLETALSPEQWHITPWFHFNPDLAKTLMVFFSDNPGQAIETAFFSPFAQKRPVLNEETALKAFSHATGLTSSGITLNPLTNSVRLTAIQRVIDAIGQNPNAHFLNINIKEFQSRTLQEAMVDY